MGRDRETDVSIKAIFLTTIYGRIKMIEEIKDKKSKKHIAHSILEALTDWFEITESRETDICI